MPDLILVLLIPVGLYLMVNVLAALLCLRPPRVPLYLTPDQMGIPGRRIELDSDGVRLAATWTSPEGPVGVLVCLHGFVMNRAEW
ncbi:MAG: hypothetical protein MH204_12365, partial [Fimbriimonadaceae bacterium]|nr:hypothetical protein [Fimbriimonadaceae bacterium]